uniref:Uncharacterized protein n=1 Tax=Oryza barthii TaxID=65489 RepID=A0A0D3H9I4_9ORYZ
MKTLHREPRPPAPEEKEKAPAAWPAGTVVVREERREHPEEDWEQRPGRRYRLIAEIYAVTEEIE